MWKSIHPNKGGITAMKKNLFISLIISFITILGLNVSARAETTIIQVTSNSCEDSMPRITGNYVVWQGYVNNNWEIFLYNIDTKATFRITNNSYNDVSPRTDGNYVVWLGASNEGSEIFLYDIAKGGSPTHITIDTNVDCPPRIADGRVVWASHQVTNSVEPGQINLYDIATGHTLQLGDFAADDCSPRINSETVIWNRVDKNDNISLYTYDLAGGTARRAPRDFIWKESPQTDGKLTVSLIHDNNNSEIIIRDSDQEEFEQITHNSINDRHPGINGNYIIWMGGEGQASEIYLALYGTGPFL